MNPEASNGRSADPEFLNDELLYRAVAPEHMFASGSLIGYEFVERDFPGVSVNRSQFSVPEDVLHACCSGSVSREEWGVAQTAVRALSGLHAESGENRMEHRRRFRVLLTHKPLDKCYAHSEIDSALGENIVPSRPTDLVRRQLRVAVARLFTPCRAPRRTGQSEEEGDLSAGFNANPGVVPL